MDQREFVATFKLRQKHVISARFVEGNDHEELYNREKPNQHPIEAITNLTETLDAKQNTLVSGVNIKTINNQDLLGEGNLTIDTGKIDDVLVNGTSVVENKIANVTVPTNNNELENGAGYITGITANDVTTALGFTPYNATNPDEYITKDVNDLTNYTLTSNLSTVALSGSYDDLNNKPTIGNATLTIQKNGTNVGTFTANSVTNSTINISVPTNVSDLNNDSDYQTETEVSTLIGAHNTSTTAHSDIRQDISSIEDLIPAQASTENKLADKDFVNSSVATNTANFIGTFENVSALNNYSGTVTNNDYAFVINSVITNSGNDWSTFADLDAYNKSLLTEFDYAWVINGTKFDLYRFDIIGQTWGLRAESTTKDAVTLNTAYNRYKATVNNNVITWNYEYTLNNSSFTANQWAAINSGITSSKVSSYDNHLSDTNNPHSVTKSQVGLGNVDNTSDANKPISTATQNALNNKQDLLIAGNGITISNSTISLTGTTQLADNTDIDTVLTEGNYFIKNPTSTKGMPELPVSSTQGTINYWIALLLVEKEYGFARYIIRQTITLSPISGAAEVISQDTLMFTRTLSDYARVGSSWTKIDGDITNLNFVNPQGDTLTVNNLYANYCYRCQYSIINGSFDTLSSLTLTNIQNTADEIRVIFKAGNNFTLTATQLTFLNYSNIVWETNKIYVITIKNLYATIDSVGNNPSLMNLIPTKVSDLNNDSGFITGITSSDVTTALGYTPYNSSNPNGYQENTIEAIQVNGVTQTITSKTVNINVPDAPTWTYDSNTETLEVE